MRVLWLAREAHTTRHEICHDDTHPTISTSTLLTIVAEMYHCRRRKTIHCILPIQALQRLLGTTSSILIPDTRIYPAVLLLNPTLPRTIGISVQTGLDPSNCTG
jgi:hypothetical protein